MNKFDRHEQSVLESMLLFLERNPPLDDDRSDFEVKENYSAAIRAAFPNPDDNVLSVGEVTRRKVMILGQELVLFVGQTGMEFDEHGNCIQVGGTKYVPVVRLPDGNLFELHDDHDLAKLRTMLNLHLAPAAEAGYRADVPAAAPVRIDRPKHEDRIEACDGTPTPRSKAD
ncbi:hypothetical protein [Mesorhizobium sp. M0254]|uniref:hypothetical protein n=1 Tax=Mesorhizobium sp. M0254 TaxID=2956927 RepID=UPI00333B0AC1